MKHHLRLHNLRQRARLKSVLRVNIALARYSSPPLRRVLNPPPHDHHPQPLGLRPLRLARYALPVHLRPLALAHARRPARRIRRLLLCEGEGRSRSLTLFHKAYPGVQVK